MDFTNIDSILKQISELSSEEEIILLRRARDRHQKDPFHDVTVCSFCLKQDFDEICNGCADILPDNSYGRNSCKCTECMKVFEFCMTIDCIQCRMQIFKGCTSMLGQYVGVCNWCAAKLPSVINCPGCESEKCVKTIQNKYCQVLTKGAQ
jgi:hypothetical protein